MKFIRRKDLDAQTRIQIVILALLNHGTYGAMSRLALNADISRTFLYQMVGTALFYLTMLFSIENSEISSDDMLTHFIVDRSLEGKCSISSISEILDWKAIKALFNWNYKPIFEILWCEFTFYLTSSRTS